MELRQSELSLLGAAYALIKNATVATLM